jgi:predicted nucleic acid-binding protein
MSDEVFVDSNVLLYLISADAAKAARTRDLIREAPVISVQVLNEFVAVCRRKFRLSWTETRLALAPIKRACPVVPLTIAAHGLAVEIAEQTGIRIYDATIVAAASLASCQILMSEDLNAGQRFGTMVIRNPFD